MGTSNSSMIWRVGGTDVDLVDGGLAFTSDISTTNEYPQGTFAQPDRPECSRSVCCTAKPFGHTRPSKTGSAVPGLGGVY